MADGLRAGDPAIVDELIEKQLICDNMRECKVANDNAIDLFGATVGDSADFLRNLIEDKMGKVENRADKSAVSVKAAEARHHEGLLPVCDPEDCRKKRCVDRYDSSESSDSGVAVLSCTDCSSGSSSTAGSDLTDPGSPFSSASSSHSSASVEDHHELKMPPAQTAHHPHWPWAAKDGDGTQPTSPESPQRAANVGTVVANLTATRLSEIPTVERHFKMDHSSGLLQRSSEKGLVTEPIVSAKNGLVTRSPTITANQSTAHQQNKRSLQEKQSYAKRLKQATTEKQLTLKNSNKQPNRTMMTNIYSDKKKINSASASNQNSSTADNQDVVILESSPNNNNNYKLNKNKVAEMTTSEQIAKLQHQGKITEYFKTQAKVNGLKKELLKGKPAKKATLPKNNIQSKVEPPPVVKEPRTPTAKKPIEQKTRKYSPTVPRKILPAPSKISETNTNIQNIAMSPMNGINKSIAMNNVNGMNKSISLNNQINGLNKSITLNTPYNPNPLGAMHPFTPTMTLTAVSFPPNVAYLHAKTPSKPPDNVFVPQINLINSPCLNIVQPVNNFNCTLNATVVPLVKLNTLPSRLNGSTNLTSSSSITNLRSSIQPLSVDTAVPTVLSTPKQPKIFESTNTVVPPSIAQIPKQYATPSIANQVERDIVCKERNSSVDEPSYRTEPMQEDSLEKTSRVQKSPSVTDSDSGISSISSNLSTASNKSLVISITDNVTAECQKSPILSQPKVIRFPPVKDPHREKKDEKESGRSPPLNDGRCRWNDCSAQFDASGALLEHLQVKHVISQSHPSNKDEQYVCLWRGCKVHGRKSCSVSWLERHVLAHAGTKPFRCIVDGCGLRFTTQLMLERHVNNHFNSDGSPNNSAKKSVENGPVKLFKRNGRIIRFRRQPWSARMFDFIDSGIMEGLQHKLLEITHTKALGQARTEGDVVQLTSQVVARKTDSDGNINFLVSWKPADICPHEWIPEKEYKTTKSVPVTALSHSSREALRQTLFPKQSVVRKHRRKPVKMTFDTT